jgi:WD40 repeat protein
VTKAARHTLKSHLGWVNAVVFSLGGKLVTSAIGDNTVRIWDSAARAVGNIF